MDPIRYAAAACQTDLPNPHRAARDAREHRPDAVDDRRRGRRAARRSCRCGWWCFRSSRTPRRSTRPSASCATSWPCRFPTSTPSGSHAKASEHGIYIQSGSMLEVDPRWPGVVFNTTCLIGPEGILYKYRKVNPWIPCEVHASPHDIPGYDEPLFPVADTPIGTHRLRDLLRLAVSRGDPPAGGQRRRGADPRLGLHGPVGRDRADGLVDGRQPLPRASRTSPTSSRPTRARACGTIRRTPGRAAAWSSTSTAASWPRPRPGPGERIVVAPDRHRAPCATSARRGAATTCWPTCGPRPIRSIGQRIYPAAGDQTAPGGLSYEGNNARIDAAKKGVRSGIVNS